MERRGWVAAPGRWGSARSVATAVAAAAGALAAAPHPTVEPVGDVVVTASFALAVAALGAGSSPRAWLAAWVAVASGGGSEATLVAALVGIATSLPGMSWSPWRTTLIGALQGGALVQVLLRMPTHRSAMNILVAALVVAVLLAGLQPGAGGPRARPALRLVGSAAALLLVASLGSLVLAQHRLRAAVDHARDGLAEARHGEGDAAGDELAAAAHQFDGARSALTAWWAAPTRFVPVLGQHDRSLEVVAAAGADLAESASQAAREAGVDDLRIVDGRIDLAQVAELDGPLADVGAALRRADATLDRARSPWLIGPVSSRIDRFDEELAEARVEARTARTAAAVAPALLGGGGEPRTYFVAFGNPAEARELGGFMGAFAILRAQDGRIDLSGTARVRDLNRLLSGRELSDRSVFPPHYLAQLPQVFWQNVTGASDFPTVAAAVMQLWPSRALGPLDGVIYMDPVVLGDLMALTGPVHLEGLDQPLSADTGADFLLRDQYGELPEDDRQDFLVEAAEVVFDRLTSRDIAGPSAVVDALAPAARARRLLVFTEDPREQAVFEDLGIDGVLRPAPGQDLLSVRSSNRGLNKVDAQLRRRVRARVEVDPSRGEVRSVVDVGLTNGAPRRGLPASVLDNRLGWPPGTSSMTLAVYTTLELVEVTVDGAPAGTAPSRAHGLERYAVLVDIPPGARVEVRFVLAGRLSAADGYQLQVVPQPLAHADDLDVRVVVADGDAGGGRRSARGPHDATESLSVRFARTERDRQND